MCTFSAGVEQGDTLPCLKSHTEMTKGWNLISRCGKLLNNSELCFLFHITKKICQSKLFLGVKMVIYERCTDTPQENCTVFANSVFKDMIPGSSAPLPLPYFPHVKKKNLLTHYILSRHCTHAVTLVPNSQFELPDALTGP